MTDDFMPDILTLSDEDGKNIEFEVLDIIEYEDEKYYVLLPRFSDPLTALKSSADYIVLKAEEESRETVFSSPGDDISCKISVIFEERYESSFYDD